MRAGRGAGMEEVGHFVGSLEVQLDNSAPDASRMNPRALTDRRVGHHAVRVLANGRVKRNTAPPPAWFSAQILPP